MLGGGAMVRDRVTGLRRPVLPADIAILFRSRDSHREFEKALDRRGVATYVYKGLGFFDADEVQDAVALLRYLADPLSNMRAATLLRSRIVRLSDAGRGGARARSLAQAIVDPEPPPAAGSSATTTTACWRGSASAVPRWLSWVDRLSPLELLDRLLAETAYAFETRGPGRRQARENLKKLRGMVARFQNRGYATLARVADHLDELAVGDESNAAIDAERRGQPDDRARGEGAGVSSRVRRQPRPRHGRRASADSRVGRRQRRAVGRHCRLPVGSRRGCARRATARRRSGCCMSR